MVTANKELIAAHAAVLAHTAAAAGLDLLYEAAVAGAIPLIRPLRESLAGERIAPGHGHRERHDQLHPHHHVRGGCLGLRDALAEAQRLGYAEPDPTADVDGHDAAAKAAILAVARVPLPTSAPTTCTVRASPLSIQSTSRSHSAWRMS